MMSSIEKMQRFSFRETSIKGLYEINPFISNDVRGSFIKDYSNNVFKENGILHDVKEVFYTTSKKGVLRGMHYQRVRQQPKLVRCISGRVFDVVVDLRTESPTFGKWLSFDLNSENSKEILVPSRCAHGYLVLEDSIVSYKCAEIFYSEFDGGIKWDDSDIGIEWPLHLIGGEDGLILSDKDRALPALSEVNLDKGSF